MKRPVVFLTSLCLILLQGCAMHSVSKVLAEKRAREKEARAAALHWLQLVDAGDYAPAYEEEATRLRTSTTEAQLIRSMEGRPVRFWRVLSRTFIGAAFTRKLAGSPDVRYESILSQTSFQHKALAAERVILTHEA